MAPHRCSQVANTSSEGTRPWSPDLHVERRVVPRHPGSLDLARPVGVVLGRGAEIRADEAPGLTLVRPVLGLEGMGGAEVHDRVGSMTAALQMRPELEVGRRLRLPPPPGL